MNIIKEAPLYETNIIQWQDKLPDDDTSYARWSVFTSDFDFPSKWNHQGWRISSTCNMGYRTDVWETTNPKIVKRDATILKITQEAWDKLHE